MEWYRVKRLGGGVYAFIDTDGGWFRSNSVAIDMGGYTLLVDTQYNGARTRSLLDAMRGEGLDAPALVVNTHHHGDHTFGNHLVQAPKIMHREAAAMVEALAPIVPGLYQHLFPHLDFTGAKYTRPEIVVDQGLLLQGDRGTVRVTYEGPAHTRGDIVVWVEWARVAVVGDLVFNGVTPLALDGSVATWEERLKSLKERLEGWTIVGGHGPPAGVEVVDLLGKYFRHVLGATRMLMGEGLRSPVEIAVKATPGPLQGWREEERLVLNVARALADIEGRPPGELLGDPSQLAAMMMEYRRRTVTD